MAADPLLPSLGATFVNKALARLLFAQGGKCFFCQDQLAPSGASVEHLVATTNGGSNSDENCVACCKALNLLLGRMSLKEKLRVVLNQKGDFRCPKGRDAEAALAQPAQKVTQAASTVDRVNLVITDLCKRRASRPRTVKTLSSTISALFKKTLADHEVESLLGSLQTQGVISVNGTKVTYHLPDGT